MTVRAAGGLARALALLTSVLVIVSTVIVVPASADDSGAPDFGRMLKKRIGDHRIGHDVGAIVIDARSGEVLWSRGPDRLLQPASNMKIVTAVTTLAALGPDRRFPTTVLQGSDPRHLILQGGGDPLLTRTNLDDLAKKVKARYAKGTRVTVHVDGDLFPAASRASGWVDAYLGNSVGMVQALGVHRDLSRHPARDAAEYFASRLRSRGLSVSIGPNKDASPDSPVLARYRGHTTADAIATMLSLSDSPIAEVLFRHVAIAAGRPPTWAGSRRAAREVLGTIGIDAAGMTLIDGSGLSRKDRISPRFLSHVLRVAKIEQPDRFAAMFRAEGDASRGQDWDAGSRLRPVLVVAVEMRSWAGAGQDRDDPRDHRPVGCGQDGQDRVADLLGHREPSPSAGTPPSTRGVPLTDWRPRSWAAGARDMPGRTCPDISVIVATFVGSSQYVNGVMGPIH